MIFDSVLIKVVGTAILLLCISAFTDKRNMELPKYLIPLFVGFTVLGIGICLGYNCGYAINPARDFAPRLFSAIIGYRGVFTLVHLLFLNLKILVDNLYLMAQNKMGTNIWKDTQ